MTVVWSYGGGTQSAKIATDIIKGILPKPDIAVMADTSREVSETWEYLNRIVQPSLDKIGLKINIISHDYSYWDIVKGNSGDILLPAFTRKNGTIGKMPTFCSNEWKQRPIRRWLREQGIEKCDLWLGISTDEIERMKVSDVGWIKNVYPLIEIIPTNRASCISSVQNFGWPPPPKSRCYMCSNMSPRSWKQLRDRKDGDFEKAVMLEKEVQKTDGDIFFHPLAIPLESAVSKSDEQTDMFSDACDSGFCFT